MANIKQALPILYKAEFSNPKDALEWNETEDGYTFMGIYQIAHPDWSGWDIIISTLSRYNDRKKVSEIMYYDEQVQRLVEDFYKTNFWDKAKLDYVDSQHTANEIFIFGVCAGMKVAIKKAQELCKIEADGIVGNQTIEALNNYDEKNFDYNFDEKEIDYFKEVVAYKPQKARFLNGWINRAHLV